MLKETMNNEPINQDSSSKFLCSKVENLVMIRYAYIRRIRRKNNCDDDDDEDDSEDEYQNEDEDENDDEEEAKEEEEKEEEEDDEYENNDEEEAKEEVEEEEDDDDDDDEYDDEEAKKMMMMMMIIMSRSVLFHKNTNFLSSAPLPTFTKSIWAALRSRALTQTWNMGVSALPLLLAFSSLTFPPG